jgi:hypothetical protein
MTFGPNEFPLLDGVGDKEGKRCHVVIGPNDERPDGVKNDPARSWVDRHRLAGKNAEAHIVMYRRNGHFRTIGFQKPVRAYLKGCVLRL